jgi:hypothetical protein
MTALADDTGNPDEVIHAKSQLTGVDSVNP